jgi:hypothetical protein
MRNLVRSIVLLLALGLSEPVLAGPLEDAHAAYLKQDYTTALRLYRQLADQGNAWAQNRLGGMYDYGRGVPQDYAQAVKWYRLAADQGYAWAQNNLGNMYELGQGVPQDYVEAHKWFNLAAASVSSGDTRERAVKNRDLVAMRMTPAQIAEAQKRASAWQPK